MESVEVKLPDGSVFAELIPIDAVPSSSAGRPKDEGDGETTTVEGGVKKTVTGVKRRKQKRRAVADNDGLEPAAPVAD
jgi:hypothetical protein